MSAQDSTVFKALFHHVCLPASLPGSADDDVVPVLSILFKHAIGATKQMRNRVATAFRADVDEILKTLQASSRLVRNEFPTAGDIIAECRDLVARARGSIFLHVRKQNAGLLIWRSTQWPDHVIIEVFEASPAPDAVLAAHCLMSDFPTASVALKTHIFTDESFMENFAKYLSSASAESIPQFSAVSRKAHVEVSEIRDTTDSAAVTSLLLALLSSVGEPANVPAFTKRLHDQVVWKRGSLSPWRRSPDYLVLRIALRRQSQNLFGDSTGLVYYKILISLLLSSLLGSSHLRDLSTDEIQHIRSKLSRRMSKLEILLQAASPASVGVIQELLDGVRSEVLSKLKSAGAVIADRVSQISATFEHKIMIPNTEERHVPQPFLWLALANSHTYLENVMRSFKNTPVITDSKSKSSPPEGKLLHISQLESFASQYSQAIREDVTLYDMLQASKLNPQKDMEAFAAGIRALSHRIVHLYKGFPLFTSSALLLAMELWVAADRAAISDFPLLADYCHPFPHDLMHALQLETTKDLGRLADVETYLTQRQRNACVQHTVFSPMTNDCFAARYFDQNNELQAMLVTIRNSALIERNEKAEELRDRMEEYNDLQNKVNALTCVTKPHEDPPHLPVCDTPNCSKDFYRREAKRMTICVFEHPLPIVEAEAKAICFELVVPRKFALYRYATLQIMTDLCRPLPTRKDEPAMSLHTFPALAKFCTVTQPKVGLASFKKSFKQTHYEGISFPVTLRDVCLPLGCKYSYYDYTRQSNIPEFCLSSFEDLLKEAQELSGLSEYLRTASLESSNHVIASSIDCPSKTNIHEWVALQLVHTGTSRRWLGLLLELASPNLNLSSEVTNSALQALMLEVGPPLERRDSLNSRAAHIVFGEPAFCTQVLRQAINLLTIVGQNYREPVKMSLAISLLLCARNFADAPTTSQTLELLSVARKRLLDWIRALTKLSMQAKDVASAKVLATYTLWATLLCRRTFVVFGRHDHHRHGTSPPELESRDAGIWLEATLSLGSVLTGFVNEPSYALRYMLVLDARTRVFIQPAVRNLLQKDPMCLLKALDYVLPGLSVSDYEVEFLPQPNWVRYTVCRSGHGSQQLLFNLWLGRLLVDGGVVGRLPDHLHKHKMIKKIFGNVRLFSTPSSIPGMQYAILHNQNGYEFHIGEINGRVGVRAVMGTTMYEILDAELFRQNGRSDLPASMIERVVPWLNLSARSIEFRPEDDLFEMKPGYWELKLNTRQASRRRFERRTRLVDPNSSFSKQICRIFTGFETPEHILVQQPDSFPFSVELPRLDIRFYQNSDGHLTSKELSVTIDTDQDVGSLRGLRGALVVRNMRNPLQRSILMRTGALHSSRSGTHVQVSIEAAGHYVKIDIDDTILGRLNPPMNPFVVYRTARLHALTSTAIPDPLTGRTGTEEALRILLSGISHPQTPLTTSALEELKAIAVLCPKRSFYPPGKKQMETVVWNASIPISSQHESFRPIVNLLLDRSEDLKCHGERSQPLSASSEDEILHTRALSSRARFERQHPYMPLFCKPRDTRYTIRNFDLHEDGRDTAYSVGALCFNPPTKFESFNLSGFLEALDNFGGFDRVWNGAHSLAQLLGMDIAGEFGTFANYLRQAKQPFEVLFSLGPASFSSGVERPDLLAFWIAYVFCNEVRSIDPPLWPNYTGFSKKATFTLQKLQDLMTGAQRPFFGPNSDKATPDMTIPELVEHNRAKAAHEAAVLVELKSICQIVCKQYPRPNLEPIPIKAELVDAALVHEIVDGEFSRRFRNFELSTYVKKVQTAVRGGSQTSWRLKFPTLPARSIAGPRSRKDRQPVPSLGSLLMEVDSPVCGQQSQAVVLPRATSSHFQKVSRQQIPFKKRTELQRLRGVLATFEQGTAIREAYASDLRNSVNAFEDQLTQNNRQNRDTTMVFHSTMKVEVGNVAKATHTSLKGLIAADDARENWLSEGGIGVDMSRLSFLETLASAAGIRMSSFARHAVTDLALALTRLQALLRAEDASLSGNKGLLAESLAYFEPNFDPYRYPDWLLLQLENNILIRKEQVQVAEATIAPRSGKNSVLQLNMGKGKSSVIIPMAASVLADGKQLVRIIVPSSLLPQAMVLLQQRLGRLLGRHLGHVPFSRATPIDVKAMIAFEKLHKLALGARSVMLCAPEHLLAIRLLGQQKVSDGDTMLAKRLLDIQKWLDDNCRDIIDESDFILSPRTALCFPSGESSIYDGNPFRWSMIQSILAIVASHLPSLKDQFPTSLEIVPREEGFPFVFILKQSVEAEIVRRVVKSIVGGVESVLTVRKLPSSDQKAISDFISVAEISKDVAEQVKGLFEDQPILYQKALLVRGLIVHRILISCLKRRWNVSYGLDPRREPVAVPYTAKSTPSERSSWAHPDVMLLFTTLSHYYSGLTGIHLKETLQFISKTDDPARVYTDLVATTKLAGRLRNWYAINIDDAVQIRTILQATKFSIGMINFFLNNVVFVAHAKSYTIKLQNSGWDSPLLTNHDHVTARSTGFSGTRDQSMLFPFTIKQEDLPQLAGTNAEVLSFMLQQRNSDVLHAVDERGLRLREFDLLCLLKTRKLRILIDAGAQILEMNNFDVVKSWLIIDTEVAAGLYFSADHIPMVLFRDGTTVTLVASAYAADLGDLLVYIDEAHCRGTDLKLSYNARGAITLGLGLTKDSFIQAAMRLRQLGTTQSIITLCPPEVMQSVLDMRLNGRLARMTPDQVSSPDILLWLMNNSCESLESVMPLFHAMGSDFLRRTNAVIKHPKILTNDRDYAGFLTAVRDLDWKTVEEMYEPFQSKQRPIGEISKTSPLLLEIKKNLKILKTSFKDTGVALHASAHAEAETEREVHVEVQSELEIVRELQRPSRPRALRYGGLSRDILDYVKSADMSRKSKVMVPYCQTLKETAAGSKHEINDSAVPGQLFISQEFNRTVVYLANKPDDHFRRFPNYVLYSAKQTALVISPEEVEDLIPLFKDKRSPDMYLLLYSPPITKRMQEDFGSMTFCTMPPLPVGLRLPSWLSLQLGVLGGALFYDYSGFQQLKSLLALENDEDALVDNGTESPTENKAETTGLTADPVGFMTSFTAALRKNSDFQQTPLGYVLARKTINETHGFFVEDELLEEEEQ